MPSVARPSRLAPQTTSGGREMAMASGQTAGTHT